MIRLITLVLLSISFSLSAGARPALGVGGGTFFEYTGTENRPEWRLPYVIEAGYYFVPDVIFAGYEFSRFSVREQDGFVSIRREQDLHLAWLRYQLLSPDLPLLLRTGIGLGVVQQTVRTTVAGETLRSRGKPEGVLAAGLGLSTIPKLGFQLSLDFRGVSSSAIEPNPTFMLVTTLAYIF